MTDRRNRRDRVIAVIGLREVCVLMAILLTGQASAQAPPPQQANAAAAGIAAPAGIPRDLARLRAQELKDVRYELSYTIIPKGISFRRA